MATRTKNNGPILNDNAVKLENYYGQLDEIFYASNTYFKYSRLECMWGVRSTRP